MIPIPRAFSRLVICLLALAPAVRSQTPGINPVKIFILAGESNMHGKGTVSPATTQGTLDYIVANDGPTGKYQFLKSGSSYVSRTDVGIRGWVPSGAPNPGNLTVGYGGNAGGLIGPELGFGHVIGDANENQVLIVKIGVDGTTLAHSFCPPSSRIGSPEPVVSADKGFYYKEIIRYVNEAKTALGATPHQIAGFGWHQGWNDRVNATYSAAYETNMANFINDIRVDLATPNMPFVIASAAMDTYQGYSQVELAQLKMANAAAYPAFAGNVAVVNTRVPYEDLEFWQSAAKSPANEGFHWNRSGKTFLHIGMAMGDAMSLLAPNRIPYRIRSSSGASGGTTLTWKNGTETPVSVRVLRNGVEIAAAATVTPPSFVDTSPPLGVSTYELQFTMPGNPSTPLTIKHNTGVTNLAARLRMNGSHLSWQNNHAYSGLTVKRGGVVIASLPGSATSYVDPAPPAGLLSYTVEPTTAGSVPAQATLKVSAYPAQTAVIYEPFDMTPDVNLEGQKGGLGLDGDWVADANLKTASGNLSFGSLPTFGNSTRRISGNGSTFIKVGTSLADAGLLADGAVLWFSFLHEEPNNGNMQPAFIFGSDSLTSYYNAISSGGSGLGVWLSGGKSPRPVAFTNGVHSSGAVQSTIGTSQVALIVGKITWGATPTAADTIQIYTPGTDLALDTPTSHSAVLDQSAFNVISMWGNGPTPRVDDIRFGASYNDVTAQSVPPTGDTTPPAISPAQIMDDKSGGDVAIGTLINYTMTFSEDMNAATVTAADFSNAGTAPVSIGSVTETTPGVFNVQATPNAAGTLRLQISAGAVLADVAGNPLDTSVAIIDNTTITVLAANVAPVAFDGSATTNEDTSVAITLSATDANPSDTLSYSVVSGPANGTLSGTAPNLIYTPNANTSGADSFTFKANDGLLDSVPVNVVITVNPVNDAPIASSGSATTNEDTAVGITLVAMDIESTVTYTVLSGPTKGTLSGTAPNLTYTPAANTNGADSFTFKANDGTVDSNIATVNLNVTAVNDAPVFTPASFTTADASEGAAYTGQTLSGRASDPDASDTISYSIVSGPSWLAVASNGTLSGTPPSGTAGLNSFTVRATDSTSATADAALQITVTGQPLSWVSTDIGTGMLAGSTTQSAGTFTQTGSGNISSTSDKLHFTYQTLTGDGEIIARINSLQNTGTSARVGVMIRDTLATNSKQILMGVSNSGTYRWARRTATGGNTSTSNSGTGTVPNIWVRLARSGTTITAYTSADGSTWTTVGSTTNTTFASTCYIGLAVASGDINTLSTAQFSNVSVTGLNTAPIAVAQNVTTDEDTATAVTLAGTDVENSALTYSVVSQPAKGTLSGIEPNLTYTPHANANGEDSFTFRVNDGLADSMPATVSISIIPVNDAPAFATSLIVSAAANEGVSYTGQTIAGSATDADSGDSITYSKVSGPAWLNVAADGTLSGTPPSGSAGLNSFVVRATDSTGDIGDTTLEITVAGLPLPWVSTDIGTGMLAGSATHNAGTFSQTGAGNISSTSDMLHFTYQTLTGDGEIIARINSLQNTGTSARIGVMIRDSLATNSKQILMGVSNSGTYRWARRTATGGNTSTTNSGTGTVPDIWVRLVRSGTTITAYKSTDGTTWTTVGSTANTTFGSTCYIGLAVASGDINTLSTAQFSNVSVTP